MNVRRSIKVVLLNKDDEVALIYIDNNKIKDVNGKYHGPFWNLVGGAVEEGETSLDTAYREIFEETGISKNDVSVGQEIWHGKVTLNIKGKDMLIDQRFFIAHTNVMNFDQSHLVDDENETVKSIKWFSLNELKQLTDLVYPKKLAEYLEPVIAGDLPTNPIEIEI